MGNCPGLLYTAASQPRNLPRSPDCGGPKISRFVPGAKASAFAALRGIPRFWLVSRAQFGLSGGQPSVRCQRRCIQVLGSRLLWITAMTVGTF